MLTECISNSACPNSFVRRRTDHLCIYPKLNTFIITVIRFRNLTSVDLVTEKATNDDDASDVKLRTGPEMTLMSKKTRWPEMETWMTKTSTELRPPMKTQKKITTAMETAEKMLTAMKATLSTTRRESTETICTLMDGEKRHVKIEIKSPPLL